MTYNNAVKYVKNAPRSHIGDHSTERFEYLCHLLDYPQRRFKYIRLAGTNGKTICGAMLSSVVSEAGYTVCELNTSDTHEARDHIRVNCEMLEIDVFTKLIETVFELSKTLKKQIELAKAELELSEELSEPLRMLPRSLLDIENASTLTRCEILLLATLIYCKSHRVDLCILESGGDSDPSLALPAPFGAIICGAIPSNDKRQIMRIKTYIQRGISEVVSAPEDPAAYKAISDTCAAINCRLSVPIRSALCIKQLSLMGCRFLYGGEEYRLSLCGRFQTTNAITAIEAFKLLRRHGYKIPLDSEKAGLSKVKIPARFEVLSINPTIIADSTYKNEAVETVCESLFDFSEMIGRSISLCLPPEPELINKYLEMLGARGYTVNEIFTVELEGNELTDISSAYRITTAPTAKALSKILFSSLSKENVLLVSGHSVFTNALRLEIVRKLQF